MCRHCHSKRPVRARGLCPVCYYDLEIRRHYKADVAIAVQPNENPEIEPEPTRLPPGPERISVLAERAGKAALWSPRDADGTPEGSWISAGVKLNRGRLGCTWGAWVYHRCRHWLYRLGTYEEYKDAERAIRRFLSKQVKPAAASVA